MGILFRKLSTYLLIIMAILTFTGCDETETKPSGVVGTLKLSITDAPADVIFEKVEIDFDKIMVNKDGGETEDGWITLNGDGGKVDLLLLTNGKLQELGVKDLEVGKYNQIRFYVSKTTVTIEGETQEIKLASNTVKLVKPFTIEDGITTELVVDFNALKSIKKTGKGYLMTPVLRLADVKTSGAIKGKVIEGNQPITVTTLIDGTDEIFGGTVAKEDGSFLLAYLEPGTYDVVVESRGYKTFKATGIVVEAGKTFELDDITLEIGDGTINEDGEGQFLESAATEKDGEKSAEDQQREDEDSVSPEDPIKEKDKKENSKPEDGATVEGDAEGAHEGVEDSTNSSEQETNGSEGDQQIEEPKESGDSKDSGEVFASYGVVPETTPDVVPAVDGAGYLKISVTDKPADEKIEKVVIHFGKIEVIKAGQGWLTVTEDAGFVDLLKLTNGKLEELVLSKLDPGQYNQIRFTVTKTELTVDGEIMEIKLASNTVKLVRPFTIESGNTTEIIADFNALKSIKKRGKTYVMTPVIRFVICDADEETTGEIVGMMRDPVDQIYITTLLAGQPYSGTVSNEDGSFKLAFLEPGIYDVLIELRGYEPYFIDGIEVNAGETVDLGDIILLPFGGGGDVIM